MRYTHTNIAAKDWRRLAEFYTRVFGCKEKPPQRNLSGEWLDRATGLTNARLEGMHLTLPGHGENGPTLEIFSYQDMQVREPVVANLAGFTHIAFEVDDFDKVYEAALEHGASDLGRPTEKIIDGVGALKLVYMRDPEGNIVELQSWEK